MLSGRHFILLGILACAGLLSVHDGQKQIEVCYQLGSIEKELRDIRSDIQLCKIKHRALQSPKAVIDRANALHLTVRPVNPDAQVLPLPTPPVIPSKVKPLSTVQIPRLPVLSAAVKAPQGR